MVGVEVYATLPDDASTLFEAYADSRLVAPKDGIGRHFNRLAMRIGGVQPDKQRKSGFLSLF